MKYSISGLFLTLSLLESLILPHGRTFGEAFGESYISSAASLEIRIFACFGILEVFDDAQHVDVCF